MIAHDEVRERLLDALDANEALPPEIAAHIDTCKSCGQFAHALREVDEELLRLPSLVAPPALLERTRAHVESMPRERSAGAPLGRPDESRSLGGFLAALLGEWFGGLVALARILARPFFAKTPSTATARASDGGPPARSFGRAWRWSFALVPVAVVVVWLASANFLAVAPSVDMGPSGPARPPTGTPVNSPTVDPTDESSLHQSWSDHRASGGDDGLQNQRGQGQVPAGEEREVSEGEIMLLLDSSETVTAGPVFEANTVEAREQVALDLPPGNHAFQLAQNAEAGWENDGQVAAQQNEGRRGREEAGDYDDREGDGTIEIAGMLGRDSITRSPVPEPPPPAEPVTTARPMDVGGRLETDEAQVTDREERSDRLANIDGRFRSQIFGAHPPRTSTETTILMPGFTAPIEPDPEEAIEGLTFRRDSGYWANTYVPGDPAVRLLRRQLADQPDALALALRVRPDAVHLEPPRRGALALHVQTDRGAVEGTSRVRMSIGLRGAAQRGGRRPSLETRVVLDLREPLDAEGQARLRALLAALSAQHEAGDHTGIVVAGPHGGVLLEPGALRFGELSVALRRVFDETTPGTPMGLREAVETAVGSLTTSADASPLGSALVLLVTPSMSEDDARSLEPLAHTGALGGVTTTAIGLRTSAPLMALERVALAGHGRRVMLETPNDAETLVRGEIQAVSRVVARAVRLRIRLAPGVSLIDVLGSAPLDEIAANRVRAAERQIDQRLAAELGIVSDRGEDEDGVQIVVPAFYADDSHQVLLDLLVSGPGPVADVSVRFKDLVVLGNGTLSERAVLRRGTASADPAERSVTAAVLGHHLTVALRAAADQLAMGRADLARIELASAQARIERASHTQPALRTDPNVAGDVSVIARYAQALDAPPPLLAESLRYAAYRRALGDPLSLDGEP